LKLTNKSFGFLLVFLLIFTSTTVFAEEPGLVSFPNPVDSKSWVLPSDMTWDDYRPIPGITWQDVDIEPERVLKGALVLADFSDQEFIVTQPVGSDVAGNPQIGDIEKGDLREFWLDYLNTPQPLNNYRTISDFWTENSHGKWKVELDAYGPYRMDHRQFQYGMGEYNQQANMPPGFRTYNLRPEAVSKSLADRNASGEKYDFIFILHSGYAETGVWQEFGEMMFMNPEDIPDEFGPPAEFGDLPNWANTRYVPWTSWFAAKAIWSSASGNTSIQGSSNGMATYAHEFGHLMGLGDNYNNPQGIPPSRSYAGSWELMSSGSFNGPGGSHTRWMIPAIQGGSTPPHHMLRNKIKQGFLSEDQYVNVNRDELAETGPVFADILARAVPTGEEFGRTGLYGMNIEMVDLTPPNSLDDDWRADMQRGAKWYNNYTIEVIDQVGYDSFVHDSGVLLAKTRNAESAPNIWVIDSHPEDINLPDFTRPDGTTAMHSKGSLEQLADALFKAGTDSGVVSEYTDEHNRLHFYMLDKKYDDVGALSYRVAVRHLDGAGSFERGVTASSSTAEQATPGRVAVQNFSVTNTGEKTDLIRINAETGAGWETMIEHNVIEVAAGETVEVPVYVDIPENKHGVTDLVFTATSETDSNKSATVINVLLNDISAAGLTSLVERYDENGEFTNSGAVRALTMHLVAVERFESQGDDDKAIKHLGGFKVLLGQQTKTGLISEKASSALLAYTDLLINK
jgi:M6 family metalloprotease-like protein